MGVNKVLIQGKMGQDPEIRYTNGGTAYCKFSLAVSKKYRDKQQKWQTETYWATCVAWDKLAEIISNHVVKGQEIFIEGRLKSNEWTKDGVKHKETQIQASEMNFCGPAPGHRKPDEEEDIPF